MSIPLFPRASRLGRIMGRTSSAKKFALLAVLGVGAMQPPPVAASTFDLAEAERAVESFRDELRALGPSFGPQRQGFMTWADGGALMIAREPGFVPQRLLSGDAGRVVRVISAGDGKSLFYVRERDNPLRRELLQLDVAGGGVPVQVASGGDVPSGTLSFAADGQAFVFVDGKGLGEFRRTNDGRWTRRSLLKADDARFEAATGIDAITYSPDGSHIAFVSERKAGHSYVAIHDVAAGRTRFASPGVFRDSTPVWSPDGTELLFIRESGNWPKAHRFSSQTEGVPWRMLAVHARTGALRTVWKADPGPGSVLRNPYRALPLWTRNGQILFAWEKTGWNLLYSVPAAGGEARLLTPGEGEVGRVTLSPDEQTLVYVANFGDPQHYHLWSVPVSGGKPVQLTSGQGGVDNPRYSAGGYLSYIAVGLDGPDRGVAIRDPAGKVRMMKILPKDVEQRNQAVWGKFLPMASATVRADDGVVSHHVVIQPRVPPPPGGYPVVIHAHGGPTSQSLPDDPYLFGHHLAHKGYLVVDMNYRGSSGFGLTYRHPAGAGATGGSELKDLAALVDYLKARGDVNPRRIGIMGASYGGYLVGLAMSRLPDDFAAGVSQFGVADWVIEMKKDAEAATGGIKDPLYYQRLLERVRIEDQAYASSPGSQIENWRGPTLLTIGDLDTSGHMEAVQDLGYQLLKQGVPVEFHVDPAGGHDVYAYEKVFEFFERTLGDAK